MTKGVYQRKPRPIRYCSISHCQKIHYGRGFCHNHYKQDEAVRYGHPYLKENRIVIYEDRAEVFLQNKNRKEVATAIVDIDDVDMIRSFKWCMTDSGYATTNYYGRMIRMHIMVLGFTGIDHINCNRLDNRKVNLRKATYQENNRRAPRRNSKTGVRGVGKRRDRFIVRINPGVKPIAIHSFSTVEEAAYVYDQFAMQIFGEFALTNFEY